MDNIYYCKKCNRIIVTPICSRCGYHAEPMGYTSEEWVKMNDDAKDKIVKELAKNSTGKSEEQLEKEANDSSLNALNAILKNVTDIRKDLHFIYIIVVIMVVLSVLEGIIIGISLG